MHRPFSFASRPGLLAWVLFAGIVASTFWVAPAGAVLATDGGGGCYVADNSQVAAATTVSCGGSGSTCNQTTNGIKTCAVSKLGNGLEFFALMMAVGGIFISAGLWAIGSRGQNPGQELTGKRGILVCLAAAMAIGAYPALSTFYTNIANSSGIDNTGVTHAAVPQVAVSSGGK